MLLSHAIPQKPTRFTPKATSNLSSSQLNNISLHSQANDFSTGPTSRQKTFLKPIHEIGKSQSIAPLFSPKGPYTLAQVFKIPPQPRSLSPIREEPKNIDGLSRIGKGSDKALSKVVSRDESMISNDKTEKLRNTHLKKTSKRPKLFNEKHLDINPLDASRKKKVNMDQIKDFASKYTLKFASGYSNKVLEKCVKVLSTETDAFILENLFPGQYSMYTTLNSNSASFPLVDTKSTLNNASKARLDTLNGPSSSSDEYNGFLPVISNKRQLGRLMNAASPGGSNDIHPSSRSASNESKVSAMSSIFGARRLKALPPMDMETFRDSLCFYTDFAHKSSLLLIEGVYKETSLDLGFCELLWDESKTGSVQLVKYFIQKIYRKMGMMVPITVKVMDYLFKTYNFERITMEFLVGNEVMYEPLTLAGMKFEKVLFKGDQKWQLFVMRKKEFYQFFNGVLTAPENINVNVSTVSTNSIMNKLAVKK